MVIIIVLLILFSGCSNTSFTVKEKTTIVNDSINNQERTPTVDTPINEEITEKTYREIWYIKNESTSYISYTVRYDSILDDGRSVTLMGPGYRNTLGKITLKEEYTAVKERLPPGTHTKLFFINKTGENSHTISTARIIRTVLDDLFVYVSNNKMFLTRWDFWSDDRERDESNPNVYISYGIETVEDMEYNTYTILITDEIVETGLSIYSIERILTLIGRDHIKHAIDFPIDGVNFKMVSDFVIAGKTLAKYLGKSEIIVIPDNIEIIGSYAFHFRDELYFAHGMENIKEIVLPDTLKIIPEHAFANLDNLEKINIPEAVTIIGDGAFVDCKSLKKINLPDSILEIERSSFYSSGIENIILLQNIKNINLYTFRGCYNLVSVSLPDGLEHIEEGAFMDCKNLEKINIPETVVSIDHNAFAGCEKLTVDILPPALWHNSHVFDYIKLDG